MPSPEYASADQAVSLTITQVADGWWVREVRDYKVVRLIHYTDWHRVERSVQLFERHDRASVGSA
jgi:hypothetical protein